MRIALIHALKHSIAPIEAAFSVLWPEARLVRAATGRQVLTAPDSAVRKLRRLLAA
jgi:hypothetical protein